MSGRQFLLNRLLTLDNQSMAGYRSFSSYSATPNSRQGCGMPPARGGQLGVGGQDTSRHHRQDASRSRLEREAIKASKPSLCIGFRTACTAPWGRERIVCPSCSTGRTLCPAEAPHGWPRSAHPTVPKDWLACVYAPSCRSDRIRAAGRSDVKCGSVHRSMCMAHHATSSSAEQSRLPIHGYIPQPKV